MNISNKKLFGSLFVITALFLGTWAYTKAEGQQITVCVQKSGLVYVIGENFKRTDCKKNDSLISWNANGLQGPKGDTGLTGPAGVDGATGAQGKTGADGLQGPIGPQGTSGVDGAPGAVGPQGSAGTATGGIDKSHVYEVSAWQNYNSYESRGSHVVEAFCHNANDILLTSEYESLLGNYDLRIDSARHIFRPLGIDSFQLSFYLGLDPYFSSNPPGQADVGVTITCLRAD